MHLVRFRSFVRRYLSVPRGFVGSSQYRPPGRYLARGLPAEQEQRTVVVHVDKLCEDLVSAFPLAVHLGGASPVVASRGC